MWKQCAKKLRFKTEVLIFFSLFTWTQELSLSCTVLEWTGENTWHCSRTHWQFMCDSDRCLKLFKSWYSNDIGWPCLKPVFSELWTEIRLLLVHWGQDLFDWHLTTTGLQYSILVRRKRLWVGRIECWGKGLWTNTSWSGKLIGRAST